MHSRGFSFGIRHKMKDVIAGIAVIAFLFLKTKEVSADLLEPKCVRSGVGPRIEGGERAQMFSSPWMVLVRSRLFCGGTLITSRFVLTAAHCITNDYTTVRLGEYALNNTGLYCINNECIPKANEIEVDWKIVHAGYNAENVINDIALLRMGREVQFTLFVKPICLLVNEHMETVSQFNITGWGQTENAKFSHILKTAVVHNVDLWFCSTKYNSSIYQSQICAGSDTSDACIGDSGGPLSADINYNGLVIPLQFGIVSYGSDNCNSFSVYTKVSNYMDWIVDAIQHYGVI